jgi:hypothetical protein
MKRAHAFALMLIALCFYGHAYAADAAQVATAAVVPTLTGWPALVVLGCTLASYCARRFLANESFFHSTGGAFLLAGLTAVLGAITQAVQLGGLHAQVIVPAITGAVLSLLASSNPSLPSGMSAKDAGRALTGPALALVFAALTLSGCYCGQAAHAQEPKCVILHQEIDCTIEAVKENAPALLPALLELVAGQGFDVAALETFLKGAGFKEGTCTLAALEEDFGKPGAAAASDPLRRRKLHDVFVAWRAKNYPGVKIRTKHGVL